MIREADEYFTAAAPIADHLFDWSGAFNSEWSAGLTTEKQAEVLWLLGIRAVQACAAAAMIDRVPPELQGFDALLREAARVRHAWADAALQQLECCGNGFTSVLDIGNTQTSDLIGDLARELETQLKLPDIYTLEGQRLRDEALGVEITTETGWLVAASGLNPVLYAPFELNRQDVSGLGPENWENGAAVRLRRLRNPSPIDAAAASDRFTALITRQGAVESVERLQVDGVAALRHVLSASVPEWEASVTVLVAGDFTYFLETGCPADVARSCESVNAVAASLRLLP